MSGAAVGCSESKRRVDRDHRRSPTVDGVEDLRVVDALQLDRRGPQVAVAKLALDDDQRHTFAGDLDRVVCHLMRR